MPDDVNSLRSQIARLRKGVTRKVSRLKQAHDVFVSGTDFDPRRPPHIHEKYNSRQLRKYAQELQGFLDRKNQYVPDSQRRPMPVREWKAYKRLEEQYNKKVEDRFSKIAGTKLPSGETVAERMAKMTPDHRQMYNPSVNAPYKPPERPSTAVAGRKALDKLKDDMEKRLKPEYFDEQGKAAMEQFEAMARIINEPELADEVKGLTNEQFSVLWNYTGFTTAISLTYEIMLKMLSDKEQPWHSDILDQSVRNSRGLIKWAKTL